MRVERPGTSTSMMSIPFARGLRWGGVGAFAALVLAPPAPVQAQTSGQRTVLEAFRDSLDHAADSTALARLETGLMRTVRRDRTDAWERLRLGFVAMRLGEVVSARWFEDAAMEFQTVTRLRPGWPYGWYGLGLAELGLSRRATGLAARAGLNPGSAFERAADAFAGAVAADPGFAPRLVDEAHFGRLARQAARSHLALEGLRRAAVRLPRDPGVLQAHGQLEREFGEPSAALRAFEALLVAPGRNRSVALLEIARTRLMLGQADGTVPYFEAAALDDRSAVQGFRADLATIASEQELRAFDERRGPARAEFLRRFWSARDEAEFLAEGTRLREHYRRLYEARQRFPRYLPVRSRDVIATVAPHEQVDDRGRVYVRHGDPDDRAELNTLGYEPNESWRYVRADGDLVLHFQARHGPDDYHLVESLFDLDARGGAGVEPQVTLTVDREEELLLRSRAGLSPLYRGDRVRSAGGERELRVAERAMSRASLTRALSTDSHRPPYARRLTATTDLAVVGREPGESGRALAHLAVGVSFPTLGSVWLGEGIAFPLRLRLVALDPEGRKAASADTVVRPVAVTYRGERWLAGVVSLPVPEGRLRVRVAVEDGEGGGALLPSRSLEVGSPAAGAWSVSDLTIGAVGGPWAVPVAGTPVALDPVGAVDREQRVGLAYEVLGRAGAEVTCQITVIRTDDEPGVAYSESWRQVMATDAEVMRHDLQVRRLKPGIYRLELTVRGGDGTLVRRWREFAVAR